MKPLLGINFWAAYFNELLLLIIISCDVCRVEYQLPNLIVGAITKESLYNAFENGITADQVSIIK